MYEKSAAYYDALYRAFGKDYPVEAAHVHGLIEAHRKSTGDRLLDVGCGTGLHLEAFASWYRTEGLDLDASMLEIARTRLPDVPIHHADMFSFSLPRKYDAVVCLFSAIGYAVTLPKLRRAVGTMAAHLVPGGILIVEPWIRAGDFEEGYLGSLFVDEPDLKIARLNISRIKGRVSLIDFEYLVGTAEGVHHFSESHRLGLFTHEEYLEAFTAAGLKPRYEEKGLSGRGLYYAVRDQDHAVRDRAVRDHAVQDQAVRDQAVQDNAVRDHAVRDKAVQDQVMQDNAVRDKTVRDQAVRDQAVRDQTVREHAAQDHAARDSEEDEPA